MLTFSVLAITIEKIKIKCVHLYDTQYTVDKIRKKRNKNKAPAMCTNSLQMSTYLLTIVLNVSTGDIMLYLEGGRGNVGQE
jgi:hypothetical protein